MASKRKCAHCKTRAGDFIVIGLQAFCDYDHAAKYAYANKHKGEAVKAKEERKRAREKKENLKSASDWIKEAQIAFNKYIRIRDHGKPCISCNTPAWVVESEQGWKVGGCWDAGHMISRGAKNQLRFNVFNCHKQCKSCNGGSGKFSHKAATVGETYRINAIAKIGVERVEALEGNQELENRDIEYLKRVKAVFLKRGRLEAKRKGIEY